MQYDERGLSLFRIGCGLALFALFVCFDLFMIFSLVAPVTAQPGCQSNILVDDFSEVITGSLPGESFTRRLNKMGGDYGVVGGTFSTDVAARRAIITASSQANYWFTKYNAKACFDLRKFKGMSFDLISPPGSDVEFTLTQHASDCTTRLQDSVYVPLTKYIKPNGQKQNVYLPFADFAKNVNQTDFDFQFLKDWTAVGFKPADGKTEFIFSNMVLHGDCNTLNAPSTNAPAAAATSTNVPAPATNAPVAAAPSTNAPVVPAPSTNAPAAAAPPKSSALAAIADTLLSFCMPILFLV